MRKRNYKLFSFALPVLFFLSGFLGIKAKPQYVTKSKYLLGTTVSITCRYDDAINKAFEEMERVENLLSKYKQDSIISEINTKKYKIVTDEVLYIIQKSKEINKLTDGAFDITVSSLVDIWKDAIKNNQLPKEELIKEKLLGVGSDKIQIDKDDFIVSIAADTQLDLGGIATGYAVDSAIGKLKKLGIKSALIDAGGDIYCLGTKNDKPWVIGIQNPRNKNEIINTLKLEDKAVTTSGDYEQYFIYEGRRYSHIINPVTGYPTDNSVASVTVTAPDCLTADALATAIFVLGKEKGLEALKNFKNVEAIVITEEDLANTKK